MTNHISLLLTKIVFVHIGSILEKEIVLPLKDILQKYFIYLKKGANNFCFASSVNNINQSAF